MKRIAKWDNLKCFLIYTVVIGHFANSYHSNWILKMISLWVYTFHMPLFMFTTGLFTRPYQEDSKLNIRKIYTYLVIGFLLKALMYFTRIYYVKHPVFNWFGDNSVPWYMFSLSIYICITWLLRKCNWKIVLPVSILISCLTGYCNDINTFLYLAKSFFFFPFYYIGYILTPQKADELVKKYWNRWLSVVFILFSIVFVIYFAPDNYSWIRIFIGRHPYTNIHTPINGWPIRILAYTISTILGLSFIRITPEKEFHPVSLIGQNTMMIYFWHKIILMIVVYGHSAKLFYHTFPGDLWLVPYLAIGFVIPILLTKDIYLPYIFIKEKKIA